MEIKDLATKVELGSDMATVRGGENAGIGNLSFDYIESYNDSYVDFGSVDMYTDVSNNNGTHSPIQIAKSLDFRPSVTTTQNSANNIAVAQQFSDFAIAWPFAN